IGSLFLFLLPSSPTDQGASRSNPSSELKQPPVAETRSPPSAPSPIQQAAAGAAARGYEFCRRGQWTQAAKEALAEVAAKPEDRILWATAAARLILAGDRDGYRQLCSQMIEQFGRTTVAEQADSLCKVCLLLPNTVDRSKLPSRVLVDGVEQGTARADWRGYF